MKVDSKVSSRLGARLRREPGESGYTLVEVTVAMALLLGMITAVLAIMTLANKTTKNNRQRIAAANLAAREVELVRNAFHSGVTPTQLAASANSVASAGDVTNPNPLPGQSPGPLVVDGTAYTLVRQVQWLPLGSGKSACDGGSVVNYPLLGVHVQVTWPSMGTVRPVVSDTVLTPTKGALNSSSAYAAVLVRDREGIPYASRTVNISGPAGTFSDLTGSDGCAVFALSSPGSYTAALNEIGFVGSDGNPAPTSTKTVNAGQLQVYSFSYDVASNVSITYGIAGTAPDSGAYALPTTLPGFTIGNSHLQPAQVRSFAGSVSSTGVLFPWLEGYTAWAGTCPDADPAASPSSGARTASGGGTKGQTDSLTLALRPVSVVVRNTSITAMTTPPRVLATSTSGSSCLAGGDKITLGRLQLDSDGSMFLRSSLPPGVWTLSFIDESANALGTLTQTATLDTDGRQVIFS